MAAFVDVFLCDPRQAHPLGTLECVDLATGDRKRGNETHTRTHTLVHVYFRARHTRY